MQINISSFSNKFIDNTIFNLLFILIPIDLLNGYFLNEDNHLPIAQFYKFILIILVSFKLFSGEKIKIIPFLYFIFFIFIIIYNLIINSIDSIFNTIIHFSKFYFVVIIYFYFTDIIIKNKTIYVEKIFKFLLFSSTFLFLSLIFGFLGFGYNTYGESNVGIKSFFNGANELAIAVTVLFAYNTYNLFYYKNKLLYKYSILIFLFLISVSISTKVAIISSIVTLVYVPTMIKVKNSKFKIIRNLIYIIFSMLFLYKFYVWFMMSDIYKRFLDFYEKTGGDLSFLFFSGRQFYVENALEIFSEKPFFLKFFGLGRGVTVEMDFFDILLNYGYFGLLYIYLFYFILFYNSFKFRKAISNPYPKLNIYINLMITFISLLSGHLIFSAMAGVFISAVNSLNIYNENRTSYDQSLKKSY